MKGMDFKQTFFIWLLLLFLLLYNLGNFGLIETTDARYAEISKEMFIQRDYLIPHLNGIKHFHKPPLIYWITAGSFRIFGINEFAARFPLAIEGLLLCIITYWIGRERWGQMSGWLSAICLFSSEMFLASTKGLNLDLLLTIFITPGLWLVWKWFTTGKTMYLYLAVISIGISTLIKGPVGAVLIAVITLAFLITTRISLPKVKLLTLLNLIVIFSIIAFPWYIIICSSNQALFSYFIKEQLLSRLTGGGLGHKFPIYYLILMFLAGFSPWVIYLPEQIKNFLKSFCFNIKRFQTENLQKNNENHSFYLFLLIWAFVPIVVFSLPATKLPYYILPAMPAFSLLAGKGWMEWLKGNTFTRYIKIATFLLALLIFTLGLILLLQGKTLIKEVRWDDIKFMIEGIGVFLIFLSALLIVGLLKKKLFIIWLSLSLLFPILFFIIQTNPGPLLINSYKNFALEIKNQLKPETKIVCYHCFLASLPFYLNREITIVDFPQALDTRFETGNKYKQYIISSSEFFKLWDKFSNNIFCILPTTELNQFKHFKILKTQGHYTLIKKEKNRRF